jgi:hypothetical protein
MSDPERNERPLEPDPVIEVYKRDVDRTLIREQLRRTVDERVPRMLGALRLATELGKAGRRARR